VEIIKFLALVAVAAMVGVWAIPVFASILYAGWRAVARRLN